MATAEQVRSRREKVLDRKSLQNGLNGQIKLDTLAFHMHPDPLTFESSQVTVIELHARIFHGFL